jgi:hypothetical protein
VYGDTYPQRHDATYIYARHTWNSGSFLDALDDFLRVEFPELSTQSFPVVLNMEGTRVAFDAHTPFRRTLPDPKSIRFAKFTFPFGPVTIEFGKRRVVEHDFTLLEGGQLSRALETPLIGCDVTRTELLSTLVARGHWAAAKIPVDILSALMLQAAPAFV